MMKKIITAIFITILMASCGGATKTEQPEKTSEHTDQPTPAGMPIALIKDVDNYFITYKPKKVEVLIQDKEEFEANFHPAKTMNNQPTEVDFTVHKVGAIVAPETNIETEIVINKTSIENRKLIVDYSINTKGEKRSFTIIPIKLFKYGTMMEIDTVSFVNKGEVISLPM